MTLHITVSRNSSFPHLPSIALGVRLSSHELLLRLSHRKEGSGLGHSHARQTWYRIFMFINLFSFLDFFPSISRRASLVGFLIDVLESK